MFPMAKQRLWKLIIAGLIAASSGAQAQQLATADRNSAIKPCVVVFGVRAEARFEIRRNVRLLEVLILAGGLTEHSQGTVEVIHTHSSCFESDSWPPRGEQRSVDIYKVSEVLRAEASANPYLRSGDVVIALEFDPIFVTGNVKTPRGIVQKQQLTLTQAIALAGGVLPGTRPDRIHIYRMKEGKVGGQILRYDLKAIKKARTPDPILQPYDIVEVDPNYHGVPIGDLLPPLQRPKLPTRIIE